MSAVDITTVAIPGQPGRAARTEITVRGSQGAAQAVIWQHGGQALGVIGIHGIMAQHFGQEPQDCEILGRCYDGSCSHLGGAQVARLHYAGMTDAAVAEVRAWYFSRLDPQGAM